MRGSHWPMRSATRRRRHDRRRPRPARRTRTPGGRAAPARGRRRLRADRGQARATTATASGRACGCDTCRGDRGRDGSTGGAGRRGTRRTRSRPRAGHASSSTRPRGSMQGGPWSWSRWGSPPTRDTCDRPSFLRATPSPSRRTTARTAASPSHRRASCASRARTVGSVDRVDLEGEIVALADGEGARWALTRDQVVDGPTDARFRVKRVAGDGTVASNPVPPGEEPSGTIAAGGGAVWVPVRDGVLRYDLTTGAFAAKIPLAPAERRAIAVGGKATYVSDGAAVLRLDPTSSAAAPAGARPSATPVLGLTSSPRDAARRAPRP